MVAKTYRWTPDRREEVESALRSAGTRSEAAKSLGVALGSLDHACDTYGLEPRALLGKGVDLAICAPPPPGLTKDELIAEMKKRFTRRAAHEEGKQLIVVNVPSNDPIALMGAGDLHLDDPGTDIGLVEEHAKIVRNTPGMYAFTPGDLLNLWIGRLARLYANQNVTAEEGWQLVEWYVELVRDWLFIVLGNHDLWAGSNSPMPWITQRAGIHSAAYDVRVALRFPNGREVRVHCRHDFPGSSIYNDSHGLTRSSLFGYRDHVKIAGHRHISSYQVVPSADTGIAMHMVRVAGYKVYDEHAVEGGFLKRSLGPAATLVIDPRLPDAHPDLLHVYWDPREGADALKWKRRRKAA